jgi:hypothetical protein
MFTHLVPLASVREFGWQYWLASAQELGKHHPTLARHNSPPALFDTN